MREGEQTMEITRSSRKSGMFAVMAVVSFANVKSTVGGVCVWERTDSPATLHSQP